MRITLSDGRCVQTHVHCALAILDALLDSAKRRPPLTLDLIAAIGRIVTSPRFLCTDRDLNIILSDADEVRAIRRPCPENAEGIPENCSYGMRYTASRCSVFLKVLTLAQIKFIYFQLPAMQAHAFSLHNTQQKLK